MPAVPLQSLWSVTAPAGPACTALATGWRAQAAVIGAGYTGLSAALHLAQAGREVAVLEAADIGAGASGSNGGQVIPGSSTIRIRSSKYSDRMSERARWRPSRRVLTWCSN